MATGSCGKVLVVEDDDSMREAIESLLHVAAVDSIMYESAERLLDDGVSGDVAACVVSDLRLPGMSGLELLGQLRVRGATAPMILITAHDSPALRAEAARKGVAAYLAKPFLGSELLIAIRDAMAPRIP
jgi:two-component system response regulator FixJ